METQPEKPVEITQYLLADRAKKQAETEMKRLRPKVLSFCQQWGSVPELEYARYEKTEMDYDTTLQWVRDQYPDLVPRVTRAVLDLEAFEQCVKEGAINISLLPDCCYTVTEIERLTPVKGDKK